MSASVSVCACVYMCLHTCIFEYLRVRENVVVCGCGVCERVWLCVWLCVVVCGCMVVCGCGGCVCERELLSMCTHMFTYIYMYVHLCACGE